MNSAPSSPTQRFSDRVEDYVRYRPGYPREVIEVLAAHYAFSERSVVADVGSGTGLLTRLFLENGNPVTGVEPNPEMRAAGEAFLAEFTPGQFTSLPGTAEATGLPDASVDWVTAGQAFHWFDHGAAAREFTRILRPGGRVLLIWNLAEEGGSPSLREYYDLCGEFGAGFDNVRQSWRVEGIGQFFTGGYHEHVMENEQSFDFAGLRGRLFSSSYIPKEGPRVEEMLARLREIFDRHAEEGRFRFPYRTRFFVGAFAP